MKKILMVIVLAVVAFLIRKSLQNYGVLAKREGF
jgi:hypothetical protein